MEPAKLEARALDLFETALDLPEGERAAWLAAQSTAEPALKTRLATMLDIDSGTGPQIITGQAFIDNEEGTTPPVERIGAYRLTDLIGRGGMGSVWRGRREAGDFTHDVAVKLIRPGVLSGALVERFEQERQILAGFSHPNIARLYDGGTTPDGAPYIIMEFIDGVPLGDWAKDGNRDLAARLSLFLQVCDAVAYAHQNLIIHRDLTPANVLVTRDGTARLIDFGIAREAEERDSTAAETPGRMSYTPGFAAPERQTGSASNTLTDIYSLGKLLEALMPSAAVPGELSAIIHKAAAQDPAARYASVTALAADIRNFREHRPVSAFEGGAFYPVAKFIRRQRAGVALGSLMLAGIISALIVTLFLYEQAETERIAADRRYEDVRALARFMMFDLYDELEKNPGNTKSIEMLATRAQTYLDSLSEDARASLDVQLEAGRGYRRLADIMGNPMIANLGKRDETGEMLDRATAELEALAAQYPDAPEALRAFGEAAFSNSVHKFVSDDDNETARALALKATGAYEQLATRPEATADDKRNLARARMMSAVPLPFLGRAEEGVETLKSIREDVKALTAEYPENEEIRSYLGSVNVETARAITRLAAAGDNSHDALPYWNEAIDIRKQTFAANPADKRPYRRLVVMYYERGAWLRDQGQYDAALADVLRSEEIARELLAEDPDDAWIARILTGIMDEKAKTLSYANRHEEALAISREAMIRNRAEIAASPDNAGKQREWAYALVLHGEIYMNAGRTAEACTFLTDARAAWAAFDTAHGISENDRNISLNNLAELEKNCPA